jgi:hypothetical protein
MRSGERGVRNSKEGHAKSWKPYAFVSGATGFSYFMPLLRSLGSFRRAITINMSLLTELGRPKKRQKKLKRLWGCWTGFVLPPLAELALKMTAITARNSEARLDRVRPHPGPLPRERETRRTSAARLMSRFQDFAKVFPKQ